jgi:hypothetical protein
MEFIENDFAKFWIEDGILYFVYKQGIKMNLEAAKRIVADRLKVQKGVSFPVFCDMKGVKDSDKPGRDYLAKEGSELVTAVAVMIDSPVTRIMLNFYLNINGPITPTRMFTEKDKALEYLATFKK